MTGHMTQPQRHMIHYMNESTMKKYHKLMRVLLETQSNENLDLKVNCAEVRSPAIISIKDTADNMLESISNLDLWT